MLVVAVVAAAAVCAGNATGGRTERLPLRSNGAIPAWLVAGPFEQGIEGFGEWRSLDAIGESSVRPRSGSLLSAPLVAGGATTWQLQSVDPRGYLDLNGSVGWTIPGRTPEQVWWTKAAYAYVRLESPAAQQLQLLVGANSQLVIFLNGARIYEFAGHRDAIPDDDTVSFPVVAGVNHLLLKIGNTHKNHRSPFFGGITFGWGSFCRVVTRDGGTPGDLALVFEDVASVPQIRLHPTFFFRQDGKTLLQQHDLELFSPGVDSTSASFSVTVNGRTLRHSLPSVRRGWNRFPLWHPAEAHDMPASCRLDIGNRSFSFADTLRAERRYELQLVFLTHTDIGYTHPQPVVKELHCSALDEVLALCRKHPDFRWTIETVWQLEQFQQSRSPEVLEELYRYMREGRIALSPVSTNPYTGWVSEEEMCRAMYPGRDAQRRVGITTPGAMYNDVPGLAWMMPRVLHDAGVRLLMCGLNEVYGGYALQRALPKAFMWEGGDGTRLAVYRNETYTEGTDYGLEREVPVIAHRMWERLLRLRAAGEDRTMVLLNSAWFDNGPPAAHQFEAAKKWNAGYAYPRFVVTTLAGAATAFLRAHGTTLPVLRGDWTSSWDMLYQGEPDRVARQRAAQQRLGAAEAFDALTTVIRPEIVPATKATDRAYSALLEYSGHGSGLEAGFGTPGENALTMQVREQYLRDATNGAMEVSARAFTRIIRAEEAFEAEGLIVMNPLSWRCTVPVGIELKDSSSRQLQVTDLVTGRVIPSFRSGHWLSFVASDLPPMGFRKYSTVPVMGIVSAPANQDLLIGGSSVENRAYRISFDAHNGQITSILDKRIGRELIASAGMPFNEPLMQTGIADRGYRRVPGDSVRCIVADERPVRLVLSFLRSGGIVERTDYTLWSDVDRVDMAHTVNLAQMSPPREVEVYAAGLPFAFKGTPSAFMDVLGGYVGAEHDRLPGALRDIYSIRRSAAVTDGSMCISVAAADSRIMFWKKDSSAGGQVLLAGLVNNFPLEWNRNEDNSGRLRLRFAFRSTPGSFDADVAARLGWELQSEFYGRATLLRSIPAEMSYLSVTGKNALLAGMKCGASAGDFVLRLSNVSPDTEAEAIITSPILFPAEASYATLIETGRTGFQKSGTGLRVRLKPSETRTVLLRKTH
jgi:hypothetical protein